MRPTISFPDLSGLPSVQQSPLPPPGATLIIDNGTFRCRAGWHTSTGHPALQFRNRLIRHPTSGDHLIGNDIPDALRPSALLSQFERNVVVDFEHTARTLEYVLRTLTASETLGEHPVLLTEAPANPDHCRQRLTELLFEQFAAPAVAFGLDAAFAFACDQPPQNAKRCALIVAIGHRCTHVLPVIAGRPLVWRGRRLNVGGWHVQRLLGDLLAVRRPALAAQLTDERVEWLLQQHCSVADDFGAVLAKWSRPEFAAEHTRRVQLPVDSCESAKCAQDDQNAELKRLLAMRTNALGEPDQRIDELTERLHRVQRTPAPKQPPATDRQRWLDEIRSERDALRRRRAAGANVARLRRQAAVQLADCRRPDAPAAFDWNAAQLLADGPDATDCRRLAECEAILRCADDGDDVFCLPDEIRQSAEWNQIHLGSESFRCVEALFQPSLIGCAECGLAELIADVLAGFHADEQRALTGDVLLTGALAKMAGMQRRLTAELRAIRPFGEPFVVRCSGQPDLDVWRGAWQATSGTESVQMFATRADYAERGTDCAPNHAWSNAIHGAEEYSATTIITQIR